MFATKNPLLTPNNYAYIYTTSLDFGQYKLMYKDTKFSYFWKYAHILEAKMGNPWRAIYRPWTCN